MGKLHCQYWADFRDVLPISRRPQQDAKYYLTYRLGPSIRLSPVANAKRGYISVELILGGGRRETRFASLQRDEQAINDVIGDASWYPELGKTECGVKLHRHGCKISSRDLWPEQREWLYEKLRLFYQAFRPRVESILAGECGARIIGHELLDDPASHARRVRRMQALSRLFDLFEGNDPDEELRRLKEDDGF